MKTIKPLKIAVLHRTFENDRTYRFVPTFFVCFPLGAPEVALQEVHMWKAAGEALGTDAPLDECMPKPTSEVLISGKAYPPGGKEAPACKVRLRFGPEDEPLIDKELYVVGDREWKNGVATDPVPFREMPVDWSRAFGGEGFDHNPSGKGAAELVDEESGHKTRPLPNVEDPKHLTKSDRDTPAPAGFGAIPLHWPQRMIKGGTYDARWQKERYPGFPEDID